MKAGGLIRRGRTLWRALDLAVQEGEIVAVLGPNGAGKSTLLKVLLGLIPLSEGTLEIAGKPARRAHPAVGYFPQRRAFDSSIRVRGRDLVALGLNGNRWGFPFPALARLLGKQDGIRAEAQRIEEAITLVGAAEYGERPIGDLSGGEQQRVLIAQAVVTRPRLLLLDEPLDSLDLKSRHAISALLHDLSRRHGIAMLLVTHDINPVLPFVNRVLTLGQGCAAVGAPDEMLTTERLSQLYDTPIEVIRSEGRLLVIGQAERGEASG